jgi:hypothetical protein
MREFVLSTALASSLALAFAGCATTDTVRDDPVEKGQSQEFSAPYDVVKAAALEAVHRLNVDIQGSDETGERFQIRFSKPISAFSWGEVGVVNVVRVDPATSRVHVNTSKRDLVQVTGTTERKFAEHIFANIAESLAEMQP